MRVIFHFSVIEFSNSYIIGSDQGGDAIIIDPGVFDTDLLQIIEQNEYYLKSVLVTHSHSAHTKGIRTLKKIYDSDIYAKNSKIGQFNTRAVRHGDTLDLNGIAVNVIEAPGHSGDSLIFHIDRLLFTGDTLSAGTLGSVHNSYSRELLISSIKENILDLEPDTIIMPGHGPPSTLAAEFKANPALADT